MICKLLFHSSVVLRYLCSVSPAHGGRRRLALQISELMIKSWPVIIGENRNHGLFVSQPGWMNNSTNRIEFLRLKRICLIHSTRSKLFLSFLSSTVENISPKTYCRWFYAHSRCYKNCFQINNSSSLDRNFNCETFKLSQEWKWKVKNLLKFKFVMNFCWKFGFQNEVKAFNFYICDFSEI